MRVLVFSIVMFLACAAQAEEAVRLGIFGVVDSVAPLAVAGREISAPEDLPVISPLGPGHEIAVGDTLAIVVQPVGEQLVATRILAVFPIVGPLGDVASASANVMGTQVHLPPDTKVKSGQAVAISGFWSGGQVITTKVRRIEWQGFAQLVGAFEEADQLLIGGTEVVGAQAAQDGFGGHVWMLSGAPEKGQLQVRLMAKGLFGGVVDLALWQGYASLPIASQTYMIHGTDVVGTARDARMPPPGTLVTRCAREGRVVTAAPEGLEAAFALLDCARHIPVD